MESTNLAESKLLNQTTNNLLHEMETEAVEETEEKQHDTQTAETFDKEMTTDQNISMVREILHKFRKSKIDLLLSKFYNANTFLL